MGSANGFAKGLFIAGDSYQVNMIGHQAKPENSKPILLRLPFQRFKIDVAIIIDKENILTVIASLDNMVRNTFQYYSCKPWHKL